MLRVGVGCVWRVRVRIGVKDWISGDGGVKVRARVKIGVRAWARVRVWVGVVGWV